MESHASYNLGQTLQRQFLIEGEEKRLRYVTGKVPVRGDMHDVELPLLQRCFHPREPERLVEQHSAAVETLHASDLLRDIGQGAFCGIRQSHRQGLRIGPWQGSRIGQRQAWSGRQSVLADEELRAIM